MSMYEFFSVIVCLFLLGHFIGEITYQICNNGRKCEIALLVVGGGLLSAFTILCIRIWLFGYPV